MKEFEEIKDINGKVYLSFNEEKEEEKNRIGNRLEDFELLKKLGEGKFGKVFKVVSKLNNKVYAMKMVNLEDLNNPENEKAFKLALNESKFLEDLSHPHIIKYYKNFIEGDYLFIITENAKNGDLAHFIDAHKKSGRPILEEELWSIFLQCMKGLAYVHKMGVIHRDIKPGNILMDNNLTIKIGDFGVSAVKKNNNDDNNDNPNVKYLNSPYLECTGTIVFTEDYAAKEMEERREYDQKIDVYSMGVTFYEMCHFHKPKQKCDEKHINYSKEMMGIINEMLEEDKDKRQTSEYFLDKIRYEFSRKYSRNTSIDAIVRCLYTLEEITEYYKKVNFNTTQKKPVTKAFIECLKNFTEEDMIYYINSIKYFREILCIENPKFDKTKEISPKAVLAFLIRQLHNEMNENVSSDNKMDNYYYIKSGEEKARTSKEEMMIIFGNKYSKQLNSYISQKMMGLSKNVFICQNCSMKTYSFCGFFFVSIDLETTIKYVNPDIEHYFYFQNKSYITIEKYCLKCLARTWHKTFKQYYMVPDYLIVIIQRGKDNSCKVPVKLKQNIDLTDLVEVQGKKYKLNGFINKNYAKERYISFIEFKYHKKWFKCEGDKVKVYEPKDHQNMFNDENGELIMAFYEALK